MCTSIYLLEISDQSYNVCLAKIKQDKPLWDYDVNYFYYVFNSK